MANIIVITSGKGGVGKTTTAINLGAAMNYFGRDVLIVDCNLSTPNIGIHLGAPSPPVNLNHVLNEKADIPEAIYEHESGIKILPASISIKDMLKNPISNLKSIKKELKQNSEFIILDCAAGLGSEALSAIELADEVIIVTNPEMPAITDALKTIKMAEKLKKPVKGIIMTRVRNNNIELQSETVKDMLEIPVLGMVPEDLDVQRSISQKDAVVHTHPKSKPARAYKEIAANILDVPYDSSRDREKLLRRILNSIKINKK